MQGINQVHRIYTGLLLDCTDLNYSPLDDASLGQRHDFALKGQCHEMVVEVRPWSGRLSLN
jgi:hypothetical protein